MKKHALVFEKSRIAAAHLEALGRRAPGIVNVVTALMASQGTPGTSMRAVKEEWKTIDLNSSAPHRDAAEDTEIDYSLSL